MALKKYALFLIVNGKEQRVGCRWRKEGTPPEHIHKELVELGYDPAITVQEEVDAVEVPASEPPMGMEAEQNATVGEEDYSNL